MSFRSYAVGASVGVSESHVDDMSTRSNLDNHGVRRPRPQIMANSATVPQAGARPAFALGEVLVRAWPLLSREGPSSDGLARRYGLLLGWHCRHAPRASQRSCSSVVRGEREQRFWEYACVRWKRERSLGAWTAVRRWQSSSAARARCVRRHWRWSAAATFGGRFADGLIAG